MYKLYFMILPPTLPLLVTAWSHIRILSLMKWLHHLLRTCSACNNTTYSISFSWMWHGSHTRTWNSKPMYGIVSLLTLQRSQTARPHALQWCWRNPNCFWSIIARMFQKNGRPHSWQVSLSTQSGVWKTKYMYNNWRNLKFQL